jgi:hypothetical protein
MPSSSARSTNRRGRARRRGRSDEVDPLTLRCHPRESGDPGLATDRLPWIPAFAGMTREG